MAKASIPVDLHNPGEVFASLGFLEAADVLWGNVEGGFDWSDQMNVRFVLEVDGTNNPFEKVLRFIVESRVIPSAPKGFRGPPEPSHISDCFPSEEARKIARKGKDTALPCRLENNGQAIHIEHWADEGAGRDNFKQFAGNQSPFKTIIPRLLDEIRGLWKNERSSLAHRPFGVLKPIGTKSWKLDARAGGASNPRDVGYSMDLQKHNLAVSPVVELFAAIGLQHARPSVNPDNQLEVKYGVWGAQVTPALARPILGCGDVGIPSKIFHFTRSTSGQGRVGQYKQVTYATEVER